MAWDYSHSPVEAVKWPEEWPGLDDAVTIYRRGVHSVYLEKKYLEQLQELIKGLKKNQAVEISGRKMSISYRMPFPNIKKN